jgi:hypothetical protein
MGNVAVNDLAFAYAVEQSLGVLPGSPAWRKLEPNNAPTWGNEITKTARSPLSDDRQDRKGIETDRNSNPEIEADLTLSHFRDFIESFACARAIGPDAYTPTAASGTGYTVAALSAAQAGRMTYGASAAKTLIHARGFRTAANNGIKPLSGAVANGATNIPVAGNVVEAPVSGQLVEAAIAGVRGAAGDIEIDADGNITSTVLDFTTLGLTPGQSIWVGGLDVANQFFETENTGFVRLVTVAAHKLTVDYHEQPFVTDDGTDDNAGGDGLQIDLLFGQFIRNVPRRHIDYLERSIQFELAMPNLGSGGTTRYEYAVGNRANEMVITIPLTNKATTTFRFVGQNTTKPTASRATGAANATEPNQTESFGTTSDIARLRLQDVDEYGLATDFKSLTLTLRNNATGDKVLGHKGPKYINNGNIQVQVEAEVILAEELVVEAIICNHTLGLAFALYNGDGGLYWDIPSGTLGGGQRNLRANESVTLQGTYMAHKDAVLGTSLGVSLFPVLPREEC